MKKNKSCFSYAVFILTRGRPDNQKTYNFLRSRGYSGKVYFVVDNDDDTLEKYIQNFGKENVLILDKSEMLEKTDTFWNLKKTNAVIFARNGALYFAKTLGLDYAILCDDDISSMRYRFVKDDKLKSYPIKSMGKLFESLIRFHNVSKTCVLGLAESFLYFGGIDGSYSSGFIWRISHFMIVKVSDMFQWSGFYFEDNICVPYNSKVGKLMWATTLVDVDAKETSIKNKGGMTESYSSNQDYYVPWFMVLMSNPDCIKLVSKGERGFKILRDTKAYEPKILNEKWVKS